MEFGRQQSYPLPGIEGGAAAHADWSRRLVVGIRVASWCRRVTAALVEADGSGPAAVLRIVATESVEVDAECAGLCQRIYDGSLQTPGEVGLLAISIANISAELTMRLLAKRCASADKVLVAGVYEPGLWHVGRDRSPAYTSLFDPARLAERTGLTVVDAFPAQDLAAGGQGGPVLALPLWTLAADIRRTRVLLDLGRTIRLTYLPARMGGGPGRLLSFDVGPGTVLPDVLAEQFTFGQYHFDPGGTLAVQGRRVADLIEHWLADPYFHRPPPRWYPMGVKPDEELHKTVQMAVETGWTVRDLLCTATHFIAESISRAILARLPQTPPIDEILLTGGGALNGFLLAEIARRLPSIPLRRADEVCSGGETLEAAAAACLALMFVDRIPGNPPAVTGATAPRVLGRLTAGSKDNWSHVCEELAAATGGAAELRRVV